MRTLLSPAGMLPEEVLLALRKESLAAEQRKGLQPGQLAVIYREEWFRLLVPARWGGRGMALPELVRLEEGIAYADGSVGWTVTLCSGAGWFAVFFPPEAFGKLFSDKQLCIAGSGAATGEAHIVPGGYRVSGQWAYASGARHALAFTANCVIWADGAPLRGADGREVIRPFLFLAAEVRVANDWNAMGLVATGSHGFSVEGLMVGSDRCFVIDAAAATDKNPLYQYPFLPLAEATLAANISGMGQHFLDCCAVLFARRGKPEAEGLLEVARAELAALREAFYRDVDESWERHGLFAAVGDASRAMVAGVREWAGRLYPFAGLGAAHVDTEINRVWRDLHTAGQHPLLVFGS